MIKTMRSSDTLIEAIKGFEGFRAEAYKCPAGVWTIGYGHTAGVKKGQRVSQARAEELLRQDLRSAEASVNKLGVAKTQGQYDALVDITFNCGDMSKSTLVRKIREGAGKDEITKEFMRWVHSDGKVLPGLIKRRKWDAERFYQ